MSNAEVTVQIHSHVDAYSNLELATQKKVSFVLVKVSFHLFISTVIGAYMLAIIIQNAFKSSLREMYYPPFLQNRGRGGGGMGHKGKYSSYRSKSNVSPAASTVCIIALMQLVRI